MAEKEFNFDLEDWIVAERVKELILERYTLKKIIEIRKGYKDDSPEYYELSDFFNACVDRAQDEITGVSHK